VSDVADATDFGARCQTAGKKGPRRKRALGPGDFVVPVGSPKYPRVKFALTLIASGCARHQVVSEVSKRFELKPRTAAGIADLAYEQMSLDQPPPVITVERERYLATLDLLLQQAVAKGQISQARMIARDRALCCGVVKSEPGDMLDRGPAAAQSLSFENLSPAEAWALQDLLVRAAEPPGRAKSDGGTRKGPEA
jgi:hypothetical protein